MKTTDKMLEATKELWKSYNEHPFVKGIQATVNIRYTDKASA